MSHRGRFPIQPPACPPSLQILFPHRPQCGSADPQCTARPAPTASGLPSPVHGHLLTAKQTCPRRCLLGPWTAKRSNQ